MNFTKEELIEQRTNFFNDIVFSLQRKIGELDQVLGQSSYQIIPKNEDFLNDPINGELMCEIKGEYFNRKFEILYSIWQVGTLLKIGFLLKTPEIYEAFGQDENSEILHVWHDKGKLVIKDIHGGLFYDWEFDASSIYESYQIQENYSMGIRHMHLRILRTIYMFLGKQ